MKKNMLVLLCILSVLPAAYAYEAGEGEAVSKQGDVPLQFSVDKHFSMHTGADLVQAGLWGYQTLDNAFLSSTFSAEGYSAKFARFGKLAAEGMLAYWGTIFQHERFGHGARAREFGLKIIKYKVKPDNGFVQYSTQDYAKLSPAQKSLFVTGGIEGNYILSEHIKYNWLVTDSMDVRASNLYFISYLDQSNYIFNTVKSGTISAGNDIAAYVKEVNTWHQKKDAVSLHRLRHYAILDLFDPFVYYSVYGMFNYVANGEQQYEYPMFNIGEYRYLPALRSVLSPWGPEWMLNNYIKGPSGQLMYIGIRNGSTAGKSSRTLTVKASDLFSWQAVYFDVRADVWHQPSISALNAANAKNKLGMAMFSTANYMIKTNIKLLGQVGYKMGGFLPGEPLKAGLVLRAGLGLYI
jgi:hypothetical protein